MLCILNGSPRLGHLAVWLALVCNCAAGQTGDRFTVEIVETDPESEATLDAREPLYLRIAYDSDVALRFQAAGFVDGMEARDTEAMNIAPSYPPGRGEAVAWVSYEAQTRIDEVRVAVFDASWKKLDTVTYPVDTHWTGVAPKAWRQPAEWARRMSAEQQSMRDPGNARSQVTDSGFNLVIMLAGWSIPGYFILQIYLLLRSRGRWRTAAGLPLLVTVPLTAYTLYALLAASNLWPLMMLFLMPFAFVYLVAVWLAKRIWGRPA
jgi:hypothetical protein